MSNDRLGRRDALVGLGAAAACTAVGLPLVARAQAPVAPVAVRPTPGAFLEAAPADDPVRALFGPLREGSAVSTHWRLEAIYRIRAGAIPVVMSTLHGGRFALEIFLAEEGGSRPIARAGQLALHLANGGDGASPTSELHGLGVMALARELDRSAVPEGLTTYRYRMASNASGAFDVPLA